MPQMSPIMWTMIMMLTSIMMIQMKSMLYFEFKKKKKSKDNEKKSKSMNWKW
uniref:ATP synthase F0 subunit 8 n=1 Tax=Pochazia guttifera TaxID=390042 RepID=UPI001EDF105D|nr:ATP synthase F0 subunit 8 [Pochazia guttifera]UJT96852.1 ATP synthase F0 subunit 8 [Pochazia guttifera]